MESGLAKRIEQLKQSEWLDSPEYVSSMISMLELAEDPKIYIETGSGTGLDKEDYLLLTGESLDDDSDIAQYN